MTTISHWFRGYRHAFRDVQLAITQYTHSIQNDEHKKGVYFSMTMTLSIHLRELKPQDSKSRQIVHQKELEFTQATSANSHSLKQQRCVLFEDGYQSGFSDVIAIIIKYGSSMSDPIARRAISLLISKLEHAQT
jgi:hypothetical protein